MTQRALLVLIPVLLFGACIQTLAPVEVRLDPAVPSVSYIEEVAPILERRCVVCHSCYNAACQLKLGSYEGVARGGSKLAVYDSARLTTQAPTRLFVDAHSTGAWRRKGFHSVTTNAAGGDFNDSLMLHLLEAKRRDPQSAGDYQPEATDLTCAENPKELSAFLSRHPKRGMPFGFPALDESEHATLAAWLQQGALGPTPEQQRSLTTPGPRAAAEIAKWESFLNRDDAKHQMTARYLYEHFFLAHLSFRNAEPGEFYELLRSATPPGQPISVIATARPYDDPRKDDPRKDDPRNDDPGNDDPGSEPFYYRFRKLHSKIVYKTHMVVEIDDGKLARIRRQFIDSAWQGAPRMMGYGDETGANPFLVYAQIPPRVRYQFLLDNAEYILRTFIRGPVCKGQIALNVIEDHFWVMFLDPGADQTVLNPDFLIEQAANLRLPTEQGSNERLLRTFSNRYRERYRAFYRAKSDLYDATDPAGPSLDAIWKGERPQDAPILTIYRHFDSASVHKGVLGDLPKTLWVIDYSQFERIYYALVAGFDVFGNLSHQVNVRRYMDYLRIEGELNFLDFLPDEVRVPTMRSWYLGDRAFENVDAEAVRSHRGTRVPFLSDNPKRELVEMLVDGHFRRDAGISFDRINYRHDGDEVPMPREFNGPDDIRRGFQALTAPGTGFIRHVNGSEANVLFVRVRNYRGADHFFTMVVNRWHDNVNSMFRESETLDPSKDTIDFLLGSIGAYPNYFLDVEARDLPDFFDMLENFDGSDAYQAKIDKYGVNRAEDRFWEAYDWFQRRLDEADPVRAGLYDLNRYYRVADPLDNGDPEQALSSASR